MKRLYSLILVLLMGATASAKLTTPQEEPSSTVYTVQNGDTLYTIAKKHHTTVAEVLKANQLDLHAMIRVGQKLQVPLNTYFPQQNSAQEQVHQTLPKSQATQRSTSKSGKVDYTVQNGDTLFTIARAHHASIQDVLDANGMARGAVIRVGQHLVVPTNTYFPDRNKPSPSGNNHTNKTSKEPTAHVTPTTAQTQSPKGTYRVQKGDTLFSVARKNHIVISKLMQYNGIKIGDSLRVGQVLKVSAHSTYVPNAKQTIIAKTEKKAAEKKRSLPVGAMPSYRVKKGDTLWQIARDHHLTLAEIRKLNKMRKHDTIRTGMLLAVGKPVQPKPKTYRVKKGDTLWLIAKKHKMSTKELRKLNHMRRKDRIRTGMVLALTHDAAVSMHTKAKREKKKHAIKTPLRIAKKAQKRSTKRTRYRSAAAILNGKSSRRSRWSGGNSKTIRIAKRYLGRRYVWGAVGPRSFDCSGFTQYVMRKSKGVRIPRVSRKQAYYGKYVSRRNLRAGDLVFFDTSHRRRGYVNHVGIYIGNNKFIHASSARHRVVITSLNRPFYSARFKWGRRVN